MDNSMKNHVTSNNGIPKNQKILLIHGRSESEYFTVPENIEIVMFTDHGKDLNGQIAVNLFDWFRSNVGFNNNANYELYNNKEYRIGDDNIHLSYYKSGEECPNLELNFISNQTTNYYSFLGIYNPYNGGLITGHPTITVIGVNRDYDKTKELYESFKENPFSLKDILSKINIEKPYRLYLLCCRGVGVEELERMMQEEPAIKGEFLLDGSGIRLDPPQSAGYKHKKTRKNKKRTNK
jgi:hypothetical protein